MSIFRILLWPFRQLPSNVVGLASQAAPPEITLEQYQAIEPCHTVRHGDTKVVYATPNVRARWRVKTLFTKEPDTIEWIAGFQPGETLIDVGANVGMYTIWAAKTRNVKVFAFEPESQNFALLYRNIVINNLSQTVVAYCAALSDKSSFSLLHLSKFRTAEACHSFGEKLDYQLEYRESAISQGCIAISLDELVAAGVLPIPDHIKIDVDGLEHKVMRGCSNVLADERVKSVLVEINTRLPEHRELITTMRALGFTYSDQQVAAALRTSGPFAGVGNHVFRR